MKQIIIATKNKGKAKEFRHFFAEHHIEALSLLDLANDIPDVEETGLTFVDNAKLKAETIALLLNKPVLADDSGLIVDKLDGRPGIYSARYAGEGKSDVANMHKVLEELTGTALEERTARFTCALAIATPGKETFTRLGYCEGVIALAEEGTKGFGYDPIFIPKGYSKTMAEISSAEKNNISHRRNAMVQLAEWIIGYKTT